VAVDNEAERLDHVFKEVRARRRQYPRWRRSRRL
jgi:hypothetical protein